MHDSRITPETQARALSWRPPGGVLGNLVAEARARAAVLRAESPFAVAAGDRNRNAASAPALEAAIREAGRRGHVAIIAEVKRRSPSKGALNAGLDACAQAAAYARGGAAAVSVLTEPVHFGGSLDDLAAARRAVSIPILRKDFHVDPLQLAEARTAGASAVLLIARALDPDSLVALADAARGRGLEFVVEIRDETELERAMAVDARLIGVNSRDLETLAVDPGVPARLIPLVPPDRVAIAESGIADVAGVERAALAGADAVLVGSSLSASPDPEAAVRALAGVARQPRRDRG